LIESSRTVRNSAMTGGHFLTQRRRSITAFAFFEP
jgi:hypothetical protein